MKLNRLLTKELEKRFNQLGVNDEKDPIVVAKYFGGAATWWATSIDEYRLTKDERYRQTNSYTEKDDMVKRGWIVDDVILFGYVTLGLGPDCDEFGSFSLKELADLKFPPFGLGVERDLYTPEQKLSEHYNCSFKK